MHYYCYILYSPVLDKFYIGETENLEARLAQHRTGFIAIAYTKQTADWEIYHAIECRSRSQARAIERHIKRMKSRVFIRNLRKYPEISERLLATYGA
jgi:putative endonuclease